MKIHKTIKLSLLASLVMAASMLLAPRMAYAENENVIRIIGDDGKVTVFELPGPEGAKAPAAQETVRTVPVRRPPDAEALREAAPSQAQPVQTAPAAPTQDVTEDVPPKKPATKRSKAAAKMPPLPGRKPIASRAAAFVPEDMPREDAVPLTRDDAVRIALKAAPPARRFQARQIVHKERPVYIVTFFTDGGPHDILVDAETGDIVQP